MITLARRFAAIPALSLTMLACSAAPSDPSAERSSSEDEALSANGHTGAVFTITNAAAGNEVLAFRRERDGSLTAAGRYATGGLGTGAGLGSQGALALSDDGRFLVVVDAGSNEVSSFEVDGASLTLRSRASSGGTQPVSVAIHDRLVYVLNAGAPNNVSGLRVDARGHLSPVSGGTRVLGGGSVGPAQVSFDPRGGAIVVTEKAANALETFPVRRDGTLGDAETIASSGQTPFGFAITEAGAIVVSEAFGGAVGRGAVSSYRWNHDPDGDGDRDRDRGLTAVSASIPDYQGAPCWVVVTRDGRYAFTANAGSASISGYHIAQGGHLTLSAADGVSAATGAGSKPLDMALDRGTRHLYLLDAGNHGIQAFDVGDDGSLTKTSAVAGLPPTAVGIAAR